MCYYFTKLGLIELIIEKNAPIGLEITRVNQNSQEIDGDWVTHGIYITSRGYIPLHYKTK